jgi:flagellar biosynthesis protein FlhB
MQADRTYKPSAKRVREARERGATAQTLELTLAVGCLAGVTALWMVAGPALSRWKALFATVVREAQRDAGFGASLNVAAALMLDVLGPILIAIAAGACATACLQLGVLLAGGRIEPRLSRLDPALGLRAIIQSFPGAVGRAAAYTVLIAAVLLWTFHMSRPLIGASPIRSPREALESTSWFLGLFLLRASVVLCTAAVIHFVYRRWKWWRNLHMTRTEAKDELRESMGNEQARGRRLQVARELRAAFEAQPPDLYVTDSSELAVGVRYDRGAPLPTIVHIARGLQTSAALGAARARGLPVVVEPRVAALLAECSVGQVIPRHAYATVASALKQRDSSVR